GGGHTAQRLLFADLLECFLVLEDGLGHVRIHPSGGDGVDQDVVRGEFGGEAFDQADDGALGGAVMGMESLAALAGGGADGNDAAGALVNHVRDAQVDDAVDAFQIDGHHAVPFALGHFFDGGFLYVPDARVGDQDVQVAETLVGKLDQLFRRGHFGEIGLEKFDAGAVAAGFLGDALGGGGVAVITEDDVRARPCEEAYRGGANAAGTAGDECGLAG